MSRVSGISEDSIPTSAHALQRQKEAKALQQLEADKAKRSLLFCITLGTIGLTGTVIRYLLGDLLKWRYRGKGYRSEFYSEEEGIRDEIEHDEFAMEAVELVRKRKKKRNLEGREKINFEEFLTSKDFWDFLDEYE